SGAEYQSAIRKIQARPQDVARWAPQDGTTTEAAQFRLVVGIWEGFANIILPLLEQGDDQYKKEVRGTIYSCAPVGLMWQILESGIEELRNNGGLPNYANAFEALKVDYEKWTYTPAGSQYRSPAAQAVVALFG
ncbi:MAG: hypothetical protein ACR2PA_09625, partial [Hyphomicrobiaceae bacterium]